MDSEFLDTGYCLNPGWLTARGAGLGRVEFHARCWLIRDTPELGNVLVDTGYSKHFLEATEKFPNRLYALATPVTLGRPAAAQLHERGIHIDTVILSHFHGDHIAGLRDFPDARILCSRDAWNAVRDRTGIAAVARGFIPELLPEDFEERTHPIEDFSAPEQRVGALFAGHRLGEFSFLHLEGHARGQLGVLHGDTFYVADALWRSENLEGHRPNPLSVLAHDDWKEYNRTLDALEQFRKQNPGIRIVGTHQEAIDG
jgi:glyoxylase-like metal-dependent hydrolase (beta-lactamase superfamily II)